MGFEPEREIGDHSKYDDWCGKVLYPINLERCWACEVPGITVFVVLISSFELEILWYHDSNCKKCHFKLQLPFPIFRIFNHDVRGLERKLLLTSYQGKTYALSFPSKTKNRLNYILEEVPLDFRDLRLLRGIRGNLSITLSPNLTTLQIYDIRRCGLTILNELDFKSIGSITLIYLLCNSDAKHVLLCDHTGLFWDYIIDGPPPRLLSELNILGPFKQVLFRNPDEDHSTGQVFLQRSNESWVLVKTTDNKLGGDYWGDSPELEIRLLI
ncbi:Hypothetical protein HVR_LOCUS848 [uncultured virus]|nr:Hypothetical protein HVR_LOCUS848 [uncultured virus]